MSIKQRFMEVRRRKGLAESTEETYWAWAEDFIHFLRTAEERWVYPDEWNEAHVERWLTHLAVNRHVSRVVVQFGRNTFLCAEQWQSALNLGFL